MSAYIYLRKGGPKEGMKEGRKENRIRKEITLNNHFSLPSVLLGRREERKERRKKKKKEGRKEGRKGELLSYTFFTRNPQ